MSWALLNDEVLEARSKQFHSSKQAKLHLLTTGFLGNFDSSAVKINLHTVRLP